MSNAAKKTDQTAAPVVQGVVMPAFDDAAWELFFSVIDGRHPALDIPRVRDEVNRLREAVAGLTDQRNELQFLYDGQAEMLRKIARVASGEDQVADDDTEGMQWIVDYIENGPESA